jgi:hypothetical protein
MSSPAEQQQQQRQQSPAIQENGIDLWRLHLSFLGSRSATNKHSWIYHSMDEGQQKVAEPSYTV